ncbi:TPA: hypothetical protein DEO28_03780 [Candidatus Dependentiae bacterium]|nr:MAG: Transcriptional regulator, CarD family [candidate division TM6 bacterium GW2011_GWE2_31_21]KKP53582.1 MAG: Transcriptional regulator, CarD family [candidate division TM6 bacterium GW2011_GWF2_33_332]HBS48178.1 hypothetical protein [Candidatus Dependentiae bacterium]HBZ73602.1 hypothetical protein [Candidatus Dependentiae bacterium]
MIFQLKDRVFYPGYGVAVIENIIEKIVANSEMRFFQLKFIYKEMTILIPYNEKVSLGIRHLSDKKTIFKALEELSKEPDKKETFFDYSPNSWNKKNRDYQLKLQTGDLIEMTKIYRDLMLASREKDLSFGEKKLLKTIKELLLEEMLVAQNIDKEVILQQLQNPFQNFNFPPDGPMDCSSISSIND